MEREKRRCGELTLGDWCWVQDYKCPFCSNEYAVGFPTEESVLHTVKCEFCYWEMVQIDPLPEEAS